LGSKFAEETAFVNDSPGRTALIGGLLVTGRSGGVDRASGEGGRNGQARG